jgi:galactokinase
VSTPATATEARTRALLAALPGDGPAILARAPGRVNLIGEHTDYNGLPVLPIAIDRDVLVAARVRPDREVELGNLDPGFPPRRYVLAADAPPFPAGDWANYHKAATVALAGVRRRLPGGSYRVHGTIPLAAGLSSSSAFVAATALAQLALAGESLPPLELAELVARGERYVGTLGGGMDQAATLLARAGHALRIDFFPLRTRAVPLPAGAALVVAHSLERAEKSGAARGDYNQRVVECRLAAALLRRRLGHRGERLGDVPDPAAVLPALSELLPERATRAELSRLLDGPDDDVTALCGEVALADPGRFVLRGRARHVLTEAARVEAAEDALLAGDLDALGALMDASHASCARDYDVSTPALDRLVVLARTHGARGARLTGAGFGGAIVALTTPDRTASLIDALDREFYRGTPPADVRLVVTASDGASVATIG